ncbi:MAG TPA: SoxR reducing system RseC family protein [Azospirillum sp.]|nr:SoxR reducing system RseC family protein [Azospirillum sp.]
MNGALGASPDLDTGDDTGRGLSEGLARVVAIDGNRVWLEPETVSGCGGCASAMICGTKSGNSRRLAAKRFAIPDEHGLRVGERVVVGVEDGALVRAAATAYALPLLLLFAGGLTAKWSGGGDGPAALAALSGLLLGFVLAHLLARRLGRRGVLTPRFVRRAPPADACHQE